MLLAVLWLLEASRLFADAGLPLSLTEIRLAAMVAAAVVLVRLSSSVLLKRNRNISIVILTAIRSAGIPIMPTEMVEIV